MSQLAQLGKTASGSITLQGVDRAANSAKNFFVVRVRFQLQSALIKGLQQFISAFEKKRAQFSPAIFRLPAHVRGSRRRYAVPLFSCTILNFCVRPNRLSACPTNRYPPGFKQFQNLSMSRFCSASSK